MSRVGDPKWLPKCCKFNNTISLAKVFFCQTVCNPKPFKGASTGIKTSLRVNHDTKLGMGVGGGIQGQLGAWAKNRLLLNQKTNER